MCLIIVIAMLIMFFTFYSYSVQFRSYEWDYRWGDYPSRARKLKHPCDQSLATYRGHSVLRTLIRCYFSPAYRYFINHIIGLVKMSTKHVSRVMAILIFWQIGWVCNTNNAFECNLNMTT